MSCGGRWKALIVAAAVQQHGNLLGNQPDKKDQHRYTQQQGAHVGKAIQRDKGINVITQPGEKEEQAEGQEHLQRRVERPDLEDDQKEPHAITQWTDVTFAYSFFRGYRYIRSGIPSTKE